MNKRAVGSCYESVAADFLVRQGLRIKERNFRCRYGEIDLIAEDLRNRIIVFVEVKYRKNDQRGLPFACVNREKQRRICRVADFYRVRFGGLKDTMFRFDVISILGNEISHFPNAFPYCR